VTRKEKPLVAERAREHKMTTESELIQKVYHTDARVTAMEGEMRVLSQGVSRIETMLLNKPGPNYLGWLGAGISIFTLCVGGVFGVAQYVELTLSPIRQDIAERESVIREFGQFKNEIHYELGKIHEWKRSDSSDKKEGG
jgi:hypothetical protein